MKLKGTKTEEILLRALEGELKASFRYRCIAELARKSGNKQVADIFEATAHNEIEHARHIFEFLGGVDNVVQDIERAIENEGMEATRFYPEAAETAKKDGLNEIADFFYRMSKVEAKHPAGFVHGGELMKIMDNAAGVVAARHSGGNVVTGLVEDIKFINPVRVGDLVIVRGKLTFVSRSSMEVQVEVETENLFGGHTGQRATALTAIFVMVALDSKGKTRQVPIIMVSTEEEEKLFNEAQYRYESRKKASKR
jgi:acyl-CoA hydrolase